MIQIFSLEGFPGPREKRRGTCELQEPQKEGCRAEHGYLAEHPQLTPDVGLAFCPIFLRLVFVVFIPPVHLKKEKEDVVMRGFRICQSAKFLQLLHQIKLS